MKGHELVRQLVAETGAEHVPLIAIATSVESGHKERQPVLELGATRFINKPIQVPKVIAEIEHVLSRKRTTHGAAIAAQGGLE